MIDLSEISYLIDKKVVLNEITFRIHQGDIIGIVGESGAGKTTLSKIIAGVLSPTSGELILSNIKMSDIQILLQNSLELINPLRKVHSILNDAKRVAKNEIDIEAYLEKVKLGKEILDKYGYQLSGGERQRIALARLLMVSPKLLILDEPFSAQDYNSQKELVQLFNRLNKEMGITILCVSHDLNIMFNFSNKLGIMKNGNLIEFGETKSIVKSPQQSYTKFLFRAIEFQLNIDDFDKLV